MPAYANDSCPPSLDVAFIAEPAPIVQDGETRLYQLDGPDEWKRRGSRLTSPLPKAEKFSTVNAPLGAQWEGAVRISPGAHAVLNAVTRAHFPLAVLAARRRLLQMHYEAKVGHIGGNLSALDAILHLLGWAMRDEDTFVLSKGHAAGALYIALWAIGRLQEEELSTFHKDGTRLAGHPVPHGHPNIAFATGSLGHGLGLAAGVALGKHLRGEPGRVFCILSDGECQEGSTFEALTFARHHNLSNLTIMVDANGLQGFGTTHEVASLDNLGALFRGLGLRTIEIDGHDEMSLLDATSEGPERDGLGPLLVVMKTIKGCGVSFMENKLEWHYLPLDAEQYGQAMHELAIRELREVAALGNRAPREPGQLWMAA